LQDRVAIVVLNWNGSNDTQMCLSSLRQLNYDNYEVIVVDNGSSDDSVDRIGSDFPEVTLMETGENQGFAGGCNRGISHALSNSADFVWLLNNDTIVDPDALRRLVDKAQQDRRIAAVGSAIYSMEDPHRLEAWGGGRVNFWLGHSRHFLAPVPDEAIDFITGASMLISREALERVGLLDEQFFMYWEDADLCFRLRLLGWATYYCPLAGVTHLTSRSSAHVPSESLVAFHRSAFRYFRKHGGSFAKLAAPVVFFALQVRVGVRLMLLRLRRRSAPPH